MRRTSGICVWVGCSPLREKARPGLLTSIFSRMIARISSRCLYHMPKPIMPHVSVLRQPATLLLKPSLGLNLQKKAVRNHMAHTSMRLTIQLYSLLPAHAVAAKVMEPAMRQMSPQNPIVR